MFGPNLLYNTQHDTSLSQPFLSPEQVHRQIFFERWRQTKPTTSHLTESRTQKVMEPWRHSWQRHVSMTRLLVLSHTTAALTFLTQILNALFFMTDDRSTFLPFPVFIIPLQFYFLFYLQAHDYYINYLALSLRVSVRASIQRAFHVLTEMLIGFSLLFLFSFLSQLFLNLLPRTFDQEYRLKAKHSAKPSVLMLPSRAVRSCRAVCSF